MTEPISDERLAEIRAWLEGVTPGPWRVCETHEGEIIGRPSWPCRRHGVEFYTPHRNRTGRTGNEPWPL